MGVVIRPVALLRVAVVGDHLLAAAAVTVLPVESRPVVLGVHPPALLAHPPARRLVTVRLRVSLVTALPPGRLATVRPRGLPGMGHRPGNLAARLLTFRRVRPPAAVCRLAMRRPACRPVLPATDLPAVNLPAVNLLAVNLLAVAINRRIRAATDLPAGSRLRAVASGARPVTGRPAVVSVLPVVSARPAAHRPAATAPPAVTAPLAASVRPACHRPQPAPPAPGFRWRR